MSIKKNYDVSIFNSYFSKKELNKYSDTYIDTLLNKCEKECLLIGIEAINSSNFNILVTNSLKNINGTISLCPLIRNLVYSYIIMRIYNFNCTINHSEIIDRNKLLENYSEFIDLPEEEINYLLKFRNIVKIIVSMFESKMIKQICMDIASILEGSGKNYICGSGETQQTKRRVLIFRKEADMYPKKRSNCFKKRKSLIKSVSNINVVKKKYNYNKSDTKSFNRNCKSNIIDNNNNFLSCENIMITRGSVIRHVPKNKRINESLKSKNKVSDRSLSEVSIISEESTKNRIIYANNMSDYLFNKDNNVILYEENIEKRMLKMFNNDIYCEMNTY